jgi:integrase
MGRRAHVTHVAARHNPVDTYTEDEVAVIAAWIGHKDATLTMRLYAHSQAEALKAAGATLDRVVSPACH